jgi:hypothetical protein
MLITLLMIATELAVLRLIANPFFASVGALGMANVACQVQYPYLAGIYTAQLWVAIACVWLLGTGRWPSRRRAPGSAHA